MEKLPGVAIVGIAFTAAGAVCFAVYYGFFNKKASEKTQRYAGYLFILFCGFILSIILGVVIVSTLGTGNSDISYSSPTSWKPSPVHYYMGVGISFAVMMVALLAFILKDSKKARKRKEREVIHRLKKHEFAKRHPDFIQCDYCGSYLEAGNNSCPVCNYGLNRPSAPLPYEESPCDPT